MKPPQRAFKEQFASGVRTLAAHLHRAVLPKPPKPLHLTPTSAAMVAPPLNIDTVLEFHRRMAGIVAGVQSAIWDKGVEELLGYATDFGLGQERGVQTLVLKTRRRSAYVRLQWDTVMGDAPEQRQQLADAVRSAIAELA